MLKFLSKLFKRQKVEYVPMTLEQALRRRGSTLPAQPAKQQEVGIDARDIVIHANANLGQFF